LEHDRFGLAVLLFHLLGMGRHPYAGVPVDIARANDEWTLEWAIRRHHFTYSRARPVQGFRPPPYAPPAEALPPEVFAMFEAAFSPDPQRRPSAQAWHDVLAGIRGLRRCPRNPAHDYGTHLSTCPWCHIHIREGGPDYFVIPGLASTAQVGVAEVERAWNEWRSVRQLDFEIMNVEDFKLPPVAARPMPMPPVRTKSIVRKWWYNRLRAMGLSIYGNLNPAYVRERDFRRRAWNVTRLRAESLVDSRNRVIAEYRKQFEQRVRTLHPKLLAEKRRIQELRNKRIEERKAAFQLRTFLDGKHLEGPGEIGIDPHGLATVLEYGIETALDVKESGVTSGLGPTLTAALEAWSAKCEREFQFDPSLPLPAEELAAIDADLSPHCAALQKRITDGLSALAGLETETRMRIVHFEKQFADSIGSLAQARADYAIAYSEGG
jgi:DNA-binding helix-hairpin-helix protein with protein kinase domain